MGSTLEKKQDMLGWMLSLVMGQGLEGIEHEGITMGFGNMDKVVVCAKCGQAWGWRERLWREIADWEKIQELQTWPV